VRAAPVLPPLCVLSGAAASGEARGEGGIFLLVLIYIWGALAAFVTLLWLVIDLVRIARCKPPLAFSYAELFVEGAATWRQVLAQVCVVVLPVLAGWGASTVCSSSLECSWDLENELLWCTPVALWLFNWLFWLGPSARTLCDRLAGGRILDNAEPLTWRSSRWPNSLLLGPLLLAAPIAASGGGGGVAGLVAASAILCVPIGILRRRRQA